MKKYTRIIVSAVIFLYITLILVLDFNFGRTIEKVKASECIMYSKDKAKALECLE